MNVRRGVNDGKVGQAGHVHAGLGADWIIKWYLSEHGEKLRTATWYEVNNKICSYWLTIAKSELTCGNYTINHWYDNAI